MSLWYHGTYRVKQPPNDVFDVGQVVVWVGRTDSSYDGVSEWTFVPWGVWAPIRDRTSEPPADQVLIVSRPWGEEPDWDQYLERVPEPPLPAGAR
jgi:hypothetical protein